MQTKSTFYDVKSEKRKKEYQGIKPQHNMASTKAYITVHIGGQEGEKKAQL